MERNIELISDFEPASSNSRLSAQKRVHSLFLSWDRLTIIGNLNDDLTVKFGNFISLHPDVFVLDTKTDFVKAKLYNGLFYMEYDKQKGLSFDRRNFRIEFNPNNCDVAAKEFLVKQVIPFLQDVGFSRLDLAFDIQEDLSQYFIMTDVPLKQTVFYGRDGKVETRYFGSRESDRYIRIYNKKQERLEVKGIELDVVDLWRIEFELKRSAVDNWTTILDDLIIKMPEWASIENMTQRLVIIGLLSEPNEWGNLSRNSRSKYRKLLKEMHGKEIHSLLKVELHRQKNGLLKELESWILQSIKI